MKKVIIAAILILILAVGLYYLPSFIRSNQVKKARQDVGNTYNPGKLPKVFADKTTEKSNAYTTVYETVTAYVAFPKSYKSIVINIPIHEKQTTYLKYYVKYDGNTAEEERKYMFPIFITDGTTHTGKLLETRFRTMVTKRGLLYYATYIDDTSKVYTGLQAKELYDNISSHANDMWNRIHWGADFTIYPPNFPGYIVILPQPNEFTHFGDQVMSVMFHTGYAVLTKPMMFSAEGEGTIMLPPGTYTGELWMNLEPVYGTTAEYVATRTYVYSNGTLVSIK